VQHPPGAGSRKPSSSSMTLNSETTCLSEHRIWPSFWRAMPCVSAILHSLRLRQMLLILSFHCSTTIARCIQKTTFYFSLFQNLPTSQVLYKTGFSSYNENTHSSPMKFILSFLSAVVAFSAQLANAAAVNVTVRRCYWNTKPRL
jgi:hypothetical protein